MRSIFCIILFFLAQISAAQQERITSFHSDIVVDTSSMITVEETIRIYSLGNQFKRGLVRELPLYREDATKERRRVNYTILSVKRDGKRSNYFTDTENGFYILRIGDKNRFLEPGKYYEYKIRYQINYQIGYFDDYDELYWNVNGNRSLLPMDTISASIEFPQNAIVQNIACYTGSYNSTARDCTANKSKNIAEFSGYNFGRREGLTIAASVPKGILFKPPPPPPPSFLQKYGAGFLGLLVTVFLSFYYINTWRKFGIDPPKPTVVPQFESPDNLSPASVGMLHKHRYWKDLFTSSLINLAVKGHIHISEEKSSGLLGLFKQKEYKITKKNGIYDYLPKEEKVILSRLFKKGNTLTIDGEYSSQIENMVNAYEMSMRRQWGPLLREGNNNRFLAVPILFLVAYIFGSILLASYFVGVNQWFFFFGFLLINFIGFLVYQWLIKKPAKRKLQLQSDIKGFQMYLSAAEEKILQQFNPPELTPDLFEKYLPFATALDVDEIWGEKFQSLINRSTFGGDDYQPTWYSGNIGNMGRFSHTLNSSLSNSISQSSIEPSSSGSGSYSGGGWSGGSGGGGFSGGGGGGGGVGGW